jgi:prefoldin beta subunit
MNKESIKQLQILEQSLHAVLVQKQQFQAQLLEIESALGELDKTDVAYKIVGNIMIGAKKADLKRDLEEKKEIFSSRVKMFEKQEQTFKEQATKLQKDLLKEKKE